MESVVAIDIGGTKLAAGIVVDGDVVIERRAPTGGVDGDALFAKLLGIVADVLSAHTAAGGEPPTAVGVGCGGPMAPGGETVSPLNISQWSEFPLRARLHDHFDVPVWIDNDAKALALAEGWKGAAQGCVDYVAMVVSTGVGGGIVVDGRLLEGASSNAGHVGHLIVEPDGRRCECGSRGCLEAEASGLSIAAITGRPASEAGPETIERTGRLVGRGVAALVVALDLRLACVAGSVALGFGAPFFAAANDELSRVARIGYARGARIVPAGLGSAGPLVGAAAVARHAAPVPFQS